MDSDDKKKSNLDYEVLQSTRFQVGFDSFMEKELRCAFFWAVGSAEILSEHPLAGCLLDAALQELQGKENSDSAMLLAKPQEFTCETGKGVLCLLNGLKVQVGSASA